MDIYNFRTYAKLHAVGAIYELPLPEKSDFQINGKMTLTFDQAAYSSLLSEVAPKVIEAEEEYDRILAVAERLTFCKKRTPEEQALHKLIVMLIEAYEAENYPMDESAPHEILQHIIK